MTVKIFRILVLIVVIALNGTCTSLFAQVGINNPDPDESAILDLRSTEKGFLIPRLSTEMRENIDAPAHALLVFDTDKNLFFYYHESLKWIALNPWRFEVPDGLFSSPEDFNIYTDPRLTGNVGIGVNSPSEKLEVAGNIKAVSVSLTNGSAPVPTGGIIMWSGNIASIPAGWALCDGTNNTPNLTDRFIVGAGASYVPRAVGGANQITLTPAQMPSHTHTPGTLNIMNSGDHTHTTNAPKANTKAVGKNSGGGEDAQTNNPDGLVEGAGNHVHPSSSFGGATGQTGGDQAHENRPPYYALAFIMKLPY